MKRIIFFYILTLFSLIYSMDDKLSLDDIVFIVRSDYICDGPDFKERNRDRCYELGQTFDVYMADRASKMARAFLAVSQVINEKLELYISNTLRNLKSKASHLHYYEPNEYQFDAKILTSLLGVPFAMEPVKKFINKVMDDSILNKFGIIEQKKAGLFTTDVEINQETFLLLNKYLNLCLDYGLYMLQKKDLPSVQYKFDHLSKIYNSYVEFMKLLKRKNLNELIEACHNFSFEIGSEYIYLKSKLSAKPKLKLSEKINKLTNLSSSLNRLSYKI